MPSVAIRAYSYDAGRNELTVRFAAFEAARSKGAFLNAEIKDQFPFRKLSAETTMPDLRAALAASAADDRA